MADNEFGKKIKDFGQNVWKKAQNTVDGVSLQNDVNTKTREVSRLYEEIGRAFCQQRPEEADAAFPELYQQIHTLQDDIERLLDKLRRLKGMKVCPGCGATVQVEAPFCSQCGTRVPDPEPIAVEPDPNGKFCHACGLWLEPDAMFCGGCGVKQEE